jgi:hypothetical protein
MPTWPATLPQKLDGAGFSIEREDNLIRSGVDYGVDKQRLRYTAVPELVEGSFIVDQAQYNTFVSFWFTDIQSGALQFDWVHPMTENPTVMEMAAPYKVTHISGDKFRITINLRILP